MTRNWTIIISRLRILIICVAVMAYGLPLTAAASSDMDMMDHEMSMDCAEVVTDHSSDDNCCDMGDCDYSCMSLSLAITNIPLSSVEMLRQSHGDRFINHMIGVDPARDSPPPQA